MLLVYNAETDLPFYIVLERKYPTKKNSYKSWLWIVRTCFYCSQCVSINFRLLTWRSDPLPFQYLAKSTTNQKNMFIDVDYPDLMKIKASIIRESNNLQQVVGTLNEGTTSGSILLASQTYVALGCDLSQLSSLESALRELNVLGEDCDLLFVAEVSLTYMGTEAADRVIEWASTICQGHSRFALLEQIIPQGETHPFARTMISHFNRLATPLKSISTYQTAQAQAERFSNKGWKSVHSRDLYEFWRNEVPTQEKIKVESVEPFDEWEEFFLFCQHYVLLVADSENLEVSSHVVKSPESQLSTANSARYITVGAPFKRRWATLGSTDDGLVYYGGLGASTRLSTSGLITSSLDAQFIVDDSSRPLPRMCHSMVKLGDSMLLMTGGRNSPGSPLSDSWLFDSKQHKWTKVESIPGSRYRHAMVSIGLSHALIFGGYRDQSCNSEWLMYDIRSDNWIKLDCDTQLGQRLSPNLCWMGEYGILSGGFDRFGAIYEDAYKWTIAGNRVLLEALPTNCLARAGSILTKWDANSVLLAGGMTQDGLLTMDSSFQVIDLRTMSITNFTIEANKEEFPMLVGFNMEVTPEKDILIVGGGAVCFSFGACWNKLVMISPREEYGMAWRAIEETPLPQDNMNLNGVSRDITECDGQINEVKPISVKAPVTAGDWQAIYAERLPALVKNADIGSCISLWTPKYLKTKIGADREITAHVSQTIFMNFQEKNFRYENMSFAKFVDHVFANEKDAKELYYLRSLSVAKPTAKPAIFSTDFPGIAADFRLPIGLSEFINDKLFSSPFRISSAGVGMWLHYDVRYITIFSTGLYKFS